MSVLAIDFGTKRVGIAISSGTLAMPLVVLPNQEDLFEKIEQIVIDKKIKKIVLGLSEAEMALKTRDFADELKGFVRVPIEFFDETLSSQEVEKRIQQQGIKKSVRSGPIDHFAAAIILEEWLEENTI
jgi:putative transcription antitermination factor YqgF